MANKNINILWRKYLIISKRIELSFLILCMIGLMLFFLIDNKSIMEFKLKGFFFFALIGGIEFIFYGAFSLFYYYTLIRIRKIHFSYMKIYRYMMLYVMYFSFLGTMAVSNIILSILLGDKRFLIFFSVFFLIYYLNRPVESRLIRTLRLDKSEIERLRHL